VATNFPTTLDDNTTLPPAATMAAENLNTGPHSSRHGNAHDAIKALEAKVGVNGSAVTTSLDYIIANLPTLTSSDNTKVSLSTAGSVTTMDVSNVCQLGNAPFVVRAATTAALAANTYTNGTAGVGAKLQATANGPIAAVDGVTLVANDIVLVNNEATAANNGVYTVTQVGVASTSPYILTRQTGYDQAGELAAGHGTLIVREGTTNAGVCYWLTGDVTTVGTTAVAYATTPLGDSRVKGGNILGLGTITFNGDTSISRSATAGVVSASAWTTSGLTGATAANRWVGATTSAAPTSGTFAVGDKIVDQTGGVWICTTAGTPGTWTSVRNPRLTTATSSATPTPNADTTDLYTLTAQAAGATFGAPTGTPYAGQKLMIRIKDNATAQTLAWNAIYRASSDLALPTTTILSKTLYLGFIYNAVDTKWDLIALLNNFT